ncbi:ThuA domain-containing protein [Marinicella sp. S1101]|uniref:ThuA domain-containing protein n=1 Tax=Marinicella marina TaxID=2996016 RepID=UPI002260A22D|nr:ThuA domain-containing protein [Marinicella marina]MCX7553046.1 ThuA domain-containing protein [Marinicella marina]MDJ1139594.1 ThuA domain-containing protein [Marinicella marina]
MKSITFWLFLGLCWLVSPVLKAQNTPTFDVLVFSKTSGFRHGSIPSAINALTELSQAHGFEVSFTEDASAFSAANLAQYEAVVFLLTSGDVLNAIEQAAFEVYIRDGGGYVGVHSASDTEYSWPWYGQLVGSYFDNHPSIQNADVLVEDATHPSTQNLPATWQRNDEWYNFQSNPRASVASDIKVLLTLDEDSYNGGQMGDDHPISWYHEYDGGRSWYTGMGHTNASYADADFRSHLLGGLLYAAGVAPADPLVVDEGGQWFKKQNSNQAFFMAGVGGPEGFLYETDQRRQEIVDELIASGANALYMHSIRSFEGDGYDFEDPFVINNDASSDIRAGVFAAWREYLLQLDAAGIVTWLHVIDDTARPWGCEVPLNQDAKRYIKALVEAFRDLDHLVWLSGEEYLMGSCSSAEDKALMEAIAAEIKLHDPIHPIGVHHNNGQAMQFGADENINVFAQQICGNNNDRSPEGVHARASQGDWVYVMAECHPWHLNLLHVDDRTNIRQSNWGSATGGGYALLYNAYECQESGKLCSRNANGDPASANDPHDPSAEVLGDLNRLKNFMLSSRFNELSPNDSIVTGDGLWAMEDSDQGLYVVYAKDEPDAVGVSGLAAVNYRLNWFNPLTGERIEDEANGSSSPFTVPVTMGSEVALYIERIGPQQNRAPQAFADAYKIATNETLAVSAPGVLINDVDQDGDDMTAVLVMPVSDGALELNPNGSFSYSPELNTEGVFQFTYQATDGELNSASTQVTIQVGVPSMSAVLIDAVENKQVVSLSDDQQLNLSQLGFTSFSIEATSTPAGTASVGFELTGPIIHSQVENVAPYALFGDNNGDFTGMQLLLGNYTLVLTAYDAASAGGAIVSSQTIAFSVVDSVDDLIFADGFD